MSDLADSATWNFLGISGPLLCASCGLPFYEGERVVFVCTGEKEALTLTPLEIEGGTAVCDEDSAEMKRQVTFDLCHEKCPA